MYDAIMYYFFSLSFFFYKFMRGMTHRVLTEMESL
jgi:hypothetical protein